jgi:hypothetical protein
MKKYSRRLRVAMLIVATSVLPVLNGCFLSDQQLSSVWQTIITSALNTIVTNALGGASTTQ